MCACRGPTLPGRALGATMRSPGIRDVPLNNGTTETQQSAKPKITMGEIVRCWMPEAIVSILSGISGAGSMPLWPNNFNRPGCGVYSLADIPPGNYSVSSAAFEGRSQLLVPLVLPMLRSLGQCPGRHRFDG